MLQHRPCSVLLYLVYFGGMRWLTLIACLQLFIVRQQPFSSCGCYLLLPVVPFFSLNLKDVQISCGFSGKKLCIVSEERDFNMLLDIMKTIVLL